MLLCHERPEQSTQPINSLNSCQQVYRNLIRNPDTSSSHSAKLLTSSSTCHLYWERSPRPPLSGHPARKRKGQQPGRELLEQFVDCLLLGSRRPCATSRNVSSLEVTKTDLCNAHGDGPSIRIAIFLAVRLV